MISLFINNKILRCASSRSDLGFIVGSITHVNISLGLGARIGRHVDNCGHIYAAGFGGAILFIAPIFFDAVQKWYWECLAILAGIVGAVLVIVPMIRDRRRAKIREIEAEADFRSRLLVLSEYTLTPLLQKLHAVLLCAKGSAKAENKSEAYREGVLTAVREQVAPGNAKATANYFKYVKGGSGGPARLVSVSSTAGSPRKEFVLDDSDLGKALKEMLSKKGGWLCEDVDDDTPPGWDASKSRNYRTFISMTAQVGSEPEGMLTVDSDLPGELDLGDLEIVRLFATFIAVAENHSKK